MSYVPIVITPTYRGERSFDIFSRLLADRIVFLQDHITSDNASVVVAEMLFLESQNPDTDITLYIDSPGGVVTAGFSILNCMNHIKCDVSCVVLGQAASMAAVILSAGTRGKRYCLPYSEVMLHQPSSAMGYAKASDIEISTNRLLSMKKTLTRIISDNCGQPYDKVAQDIDRDFFLSADEALTYGIIDGIL